MTDTLTDEKLSKLAEALAVDMNLPTLGLKLGFRQTKVNYYMGINKKNDSFEGTNNMLFDWKKKTPRAKQIPDLVKALGDSSLADFVDEFFPEGGQQQETASDPSPAAMSAATSTSRSNKREVTNGEITKLSKLLPDGKYNELCEILGFDFNYLQKIKTKNFMDSTAAFKEILQEWKSKGRSMEDLDAALREAELGRLVSEYKN